MRRWVLQFLFIWVFVIDAFSLQANESNPYLLGVGRYDITGPAAEAEMMGYARIEQRDKGLHQRLWSRAFIAVDRATQKRVVFVSTDLGMVFQSVKQGVIQALEAHYGNLYRDDNVLISAIHTHSGPAGYAHYALFNITALGFDRQNYEAIVSGIVKSIEIAHDHLQPGHILFNEGTLLDANGNRSIKAYLKNPPEERARYTYDVDKTMSLLKWEHADGKPIGMVNWFPVHGVSMSPENTLISGDNKGYASYLFEKNQGTDYLNPESFVAAFAQANEGDVTPNIFGQVFDGNCLDFRCGDLYRTSLIAHRQFNEASALYETASEWVEGPVDYRHQYVDMVHQHVSDGSNQSATTCLGAVGYAFAAGTTDGPGPSFFHQGDLVSNPYLDVVRNCLTPPTTAQLDCQKPKPVLLSIGTNQPYAWAPSIMPVQVLRIGSVAILGVPGEMTTMSGRRLREYVQPLLPSGVKHVVIAGLSNSYAGYIADPEEYDQQNYEGGFTVFGRETLPAYLQVFGRLAQDLSAHRESDPGPKPLDLSQHQMSFIPMVVFDDVPLGKHFGDVIEEAFPSYPRGAVVSVRFWGAHPRNDLETMKGFLTVERQEGGAWVPVLHDWDWDTMYAWQRVGIAYSQITVVWHIAEDTPPGLYRIVHDGHYKYGWNGKIYPYQGSSRTFTVT